MDLPTQQKAVIFNTSTKKSDLSLLSLTTSAPISHPSDTHLLRVHSTAITNGELTWTAFVDWPTEHIPCYDVSGTILTTVRDSPFQIGDKVYGRIAAGREGAACQYSAILPQEAAHVPQGLSMEDAAMVPMSAHTAWQAVFEQGALTGSFANVPFVNEAGDLVGGQAEGKRVLVLGAAGGVGLFATQFARLAGAHVVGTASGKNEQLVKSMGCDEVIDYTKTSVEAWVERREDRKFDLVFDCVGGRSMLDGWNGVKSGGVYVSVVPGFKDPEGGKPEGAKGWFFIMESRGKELEAVGRFITKGLVKTWVDSVWSIEDYRKAFEKTATGHARGKVVIKIGEDEE